MIHAHILLAWRASLLLPSSIPRKPPSSTAHSRTGNFRATCGSHGSYLKIEVNHMGFGRIHNLQVKSSGFGSGRNGERDVNNR